MTIFVRHGRSLPRPDVASDDWPLDPDGHTDIQALARLLPSLPVVCSDMRRAVETAAFFGVPAVDARLREVSRPFVEDPSMSLSHYLSGRPVDGWEAQNNAIARIDAAVTEHGEAIYVTHGTVLSLYMATRCQTLDAYSFWTALQNPDAWHVDQGRAVRIDQLQG